MRIGQSAQYIQRRSDSLIFFSLARCPLLDSSIKEGLQKPSGHDLFVRFLLPLFLHVQLYIHGNIQHYLRLTLTQATKKAALIMGLFQRNNSA